MFMAGILLAFFTIGTQRAVAQKKGHKIKFEIKNYHKDSTVYLAYRSGTQQFLKDTTVVGENGKFEFSGPEALPAGVYTLVGRKNTMTKPKKPDEKPKVKVEKVFLFEFLVEDQHFKIYSDTLHYINNLKFEDSPQNSAFLDYQRFMMETGGKIAKLREQQTKAETANDKKESKRLGEEIDALNERIKKKQEGIQTEYKGTLMEVILRSQQDPIIPEEVKEENKKDTTTNLEYLWYKQHYFDNIDFTDDRVTRTPVYQSKLKYFFEKMVPQIPDSINKDIDRIFKLIGDNQEFYKQTFIHLYQTYNSSRILCVDKVFVHLALNYYTKERAFWATEKQLKKIRARGQELSQTTCGSIAPNMRLKSPDGKWYNMHRMEDDILILFFWDPKCSHCKKSMPAMKEFYTKFKPKGVEIMAICTQQDSKEWRDYIKENNLEWINVTDNTTDAFLNNFRDIYDVYTTPQIYVLDKNKIIRGKKIGAEQLGDFVEHFIEMEYGTNKP